MPNNKLRFIDRKRTLIAPVVLGGLVVILLVAALLWKSRTPAPVPAPEPPAAAPAAKVAPTAIPLPPPPLGRRDIADAARLAAAAYAARAPRDPKANTDLIGRHFALRIPFGCDGPQVSAGSSQAYFEFDPMKGTSKLVARPSDWMALPAIPQATGEKMVEDVEGFWLPRPWSFAETCPPRRDAPAPAAPTPVAAQSVGLARVFEKDGSRLLRRDGRAYEFVRKKPADNGPMATTTYRLVLEGRVVGFSDGQAIRCWSETADHRPTCLLGVEFDRVAFEDASGQLLSEWRD